MGVDSKRVLPLPAPTETDTNTPTELTDVSKPGDEKSSYSIPDDGTPVTIRTRGHKSNKSQTSLLIEYFEGSRPGHDGGSRAERRPSVRVRLTPSKKGKGDHFQVTESSSRKASLTRRIPLDEGPSTRQIELPDAGAEDSNSMASYTSATEESNVSRNPINIEIDHSQRRRRPASPLIPSQESYQPVNASDISAIPADSFLDGSGPGETDLKRSASPSHVGAVAAAAGVGALAGGAAEHVHSSKRKDRVRTADKSKEKSDRRRRSKSRTSSVSEHAADDSRSARHRSSRAPQESAVSDVDSSVLASNLAPGQRSDTHSMRSGASRSSINNPKLLETVEDAIRRLILPELSALKRESSQRETRRGSLTSTGTSVSREDAATPDRRRSSGQRSSSATAGKRRNREARHDYGDGSPRSVSRESINDEYLDDDVDPVTPRRTGDLLKAAAAGAAMSKGLSALDDDRSQSDDRRQRDRRRRRTEAARSRSLGRERYADEYQDDQPAPAPPMPLMSDVNPSDMTRTSILSAETDRPHSASEEMGPDASQMDTVDLQRTLGTSYANVSHGDLTALPRGQKAPGFSEEYETDEFGRKVPVMGYHEDDYRDDQDRDFSDPGDYPDRAYEDEYYSTQDVPPPLKYVPYQAGARGLSPIPSVDGYTEGGSEAQYPRNSRSMHSMSDRYPSPDKSLGQAGYAGSSHSLDSIPSNMRSREFDHHSAGARSSGDSAADYRDRDRDRDTMYTGPSELTESSTHQAVRGIGANPNIVHPPAGVESAVASLVDGSMLEPSVLTSTSGRDYAAQRDSSLSYDDGQGSRGVSPEKFSAEAQRGLVGERRHTPGEGSQDHSQELSEYELDDQGRKVARSRYRHSPTASEAAITAGAVGAAAAALKAAQERRQATVEGEPSDNWVPLGVGRNKSFKERTMEGYEPRSTPAHSVDRFSYEETPRLSATAAPDPDDLQPDVGYLQEEMKTEPSVVRDRLDGIPDEDDHWGRATPTQRSFAGAGSDLGGHDLDDKHSAGGGGRGLGISETAGAAALGAAAGLAAGGLAAGHSRQASQEPDDWQRTSDERKRDTLLTNPYEDTSPMENPTLGDNILPGARGLDTPYGGAYDVGSPGLGPKYDEGYMSNGPNVPSPSVEPKGKAIHLGDAPKTVGGEDPFYAPKGEAGTRQLSGMSQGMGSPFYDAATGAGIDRIENKDIVALMQHVSDHSRSRGGSSTALTLTEAHGSRCPAQRS